MLMTYSKAEQKRIANLKKFFAACGVDGLASCSMRAQFPSLMSAILGDRTKKLKASIIKAGWVKTERDNLGGGEISVTYAHPALKGSIEIVETKGSPFYNKVYLAAY